MFALVDARDKAVAVADRPAFGFVAGMGRRAQERQPHFAVPEIRTVRSVVNAGQGRPGASRHDGRPFLGHRFSAVTGKGFASVSRLTDISGFPERRRDRQLQHVVLLVPEDAGLDFDLRALFGQLVAEENGRSPVHEAGFDDRPDGAVFDHPDGRQDRAGEPGQPRTLFGRSGLEPAGLFAEAEDGLSPGIGVVGHEERPERPGR